MVTGTPRHTWVGKPDLSTPVTATKLNELEQDVADALATAAAGSTLDAEQVQDIVGGVFSGQTGQVSAAYDDAAGHVALGVTGFGNVDNTRDADKPISTAAAVAIAALQARLAALEAAPNIRCVGTVAALISDPNTTRPSGSVPVYWLCANGVTPNNAAAGDLIWNAP